MTMTQIFAYVKYYNGLPMEKEKTKTFVLFLNENFAGAITQNNIKRMLRCVT